MFHCAISLVNAHIGMFLFTISDFWKCQKQFENFIWKYVVKDYSVQLLNKYITKTPDDEFPFQPKKLRRPRPVAIPAPTRARYWRGSSR